MPTKKPVGYSDRTTSPTWRASDMLGTLITLAIVTTPIVGLLWFAFLVWEAFEDARGR